MISGQVDRLRTAAQTYRRLGNHSAESMLLDAADTIWELRDDLQRANAENAELREELADAPKCETCEAMLDCDECLRADGSHKERRRLSAENAKLRELVRGLHMAYVGALNECEGMDAGLIWDHCDMVDAELAKSHARFEVDRQRFDVAMRELRIEVDE